MKDSSSFLLFSGFVLIILVLNTGCGLAGRHSDAKVVNSEQPTILKDTAKRMADTTSANQADH